MMFPRGASIEYPRGLGRAWVSVIVHELSKIFPLPTASSERLTMLSVQAPLMSGVWPPSLATVLIDPIIASTKVNGTWFYSSDG